MPITRAYILLLASENQTDEAIASWLQVNVSTVERKSKKFVMGEIDYALQDSPHSPKNSQLDAVQEAFLIATACSIPPEGS